MGTLPPAPANTSYPPSCPLRRLLLLLAVCTLAAAPAARAQTADTARGTVTVSADLLESGTEGAERVQRLTGTVVVLQGSTRLTAERATRYLDRREIVFGGNVRIVESGDTLDAPAVTYSTASKVGTATGGVRLGDGEVVVRAPSARYYGDGRRADLDGPVRLVQLEDGALLTAERGTYFTDTKRADFEGAVRLVDSTSVLTSRRGTYFTEGKRAAFEGDVRLVDSTSVLTADRGEYFRDEERAVFDGNVRLEDSTSVLTAERGVYLRGDERADFTGAVHLDRPSDDGADALDADTLTYFRADERSLARGRVRLARAEKDSAGAVVGLALLVADRAENDGRARTSRADRAGPDRPQPLFVRAALDSTGAPTDTLAIAADRLVLAREDSTSTLAARGAVALWSPGYAAVSDSASVVRTGARGEERDDARLFGAPVGFVDRAQVTADTLRLIALGGEVDSLYAFPDAFVAEADTATGRIQQAKGRQLVGGFDGRVRRFTLGPNAEAIRWLSRGDAPDGAIRATADRLLLVTDGDTLRRIEALDGVEGTQYAENLVPAGLALPGLAWQPERRPSWAALTAARALPPLAAPAAPPPAPSAPGSATGPPASRGDR